MQNAVPKGEGGMLAVLGSTVNQIEKILKDNQNSFIAQIANDNSEGQIVLSGKNDDLNKLIEVLKTNGIKNIKLSVSAPFHCQLMKKATDIMNDEIKKVEFKDPNNILISNVTANEMKKTSEIKDLLIQNLESRVRWRESVLFMISKGVDYFIEIGPGKVLSGLIKRINKDVKVSAINNEEDISRIDIND